MTSAAPDDPTALAPGLRRAEAIGSAAVPAPAADAATSGRRRMTATDPVGLTGPGAPAGAARHPSLPARGDRRDLEVGRTGRSPVEAVAGRRARCAGTAQVVRFNWPKYVAAGIALGAALVAVAVGGVPPVLLVPVTVTAGLGTFWTVTSLVATWWVYDHRRVDDLLAAGLVPLGRWASVHAGFDDATPRVAASIGYPPVAVVELHLRRPAAPSLRRARRRQGGVARSTPDGLPIRDGGLDTVFVTFAAHEVRDPDDQNRLFAELRRVLRPAGRLVVTEHLRDVANVLVYGPGAWHFQPGRTWHRCATRTGLRLVDDTALTPFVHRFTWRR